MSKPLQPRLAKQLVGLILSCYFVVAISFTAFQLGMEFRNEKQNLNAQIESLALTFQPAVSEALWNYDDDQLTATLQGLYRNEEVVGVIVEGKPDSDRQYTIGLVENTEESRVNNVVAVQASETDSTPIWQGVYDVLYVNSYPLVSPSDNTEVLGEMRLYSSSKTVIARTYSTFVLTIISAFVKTLALWLLAVVIINKLVGKPLQQITTDIEGFDVNDSLTVPSIAANNGPDNELIALENSFANLCQLLVDKNGEVIAHTQNLESLVQQRTLELNESVQQLTQLNKIKSIFLANMSHELRTPLNSIIGFTRRLKNNKEGELPQKAVDRLTIVLNNSLHLLNLINDILDMSKIESGKMEVDISTCILKDEIDQAVQTIQPLLEDKQLSLSIDIDDVDMVDADSKRLQQILNNLLSNAVKFTNEGSICLSVKAEERDGAFGVAITVADSGIGISEDDLPRLFNQFEQLGTAPLNSIPGTGLGLALTKQLVELHRGTVSVESCLGEGSVFTVWLPRHYTENKPAAQQPHAVI